MMEIETNSALTRNQLQDLYLDLLKGVLTRTICPDRLRPISASALRAKSFPVRVAFRALESVVAPMGLKLCRIKYDQSVRFDGRDWPSQAETMVGMERLRNVESCVRDVIRRGVPGDLVETGVWRGGVCILMRAILKITGDESRNVWLADSFEGLPEPDDRYAQDADSTWHKYSDTLAISLDEVRNNFERYGLFDNRVKFLKGWFKDTLPTAPIETIAVLRLDGDMYASTMDSLTSLYPKLTAGGYLIVDDYGALESCSRAVQDYRAQHGITEEIHPVDWSGIYWQKGVL